MILGHINEVGNISDLPEILQKALRYIKEHDLAAHPAGRFEIEGENLILQVMDLVTATRAALRPERHEKYVDVQFLASGGPERIGWYPNFGSNEIDEDFLHEPRDICFYKNNDVHRESLIEMLPGSYAVFFPWDVHIPAIAVDMPVPIRKIVMKASFSLCKALHAARLGT